MEFDYLHDALPPIVLRLTSLRISNVAAPAFVAVVAACAISIGAWTLERVHLSEARSTEGVQRERLASARIKLSHARIAIADIDALLALEREIDDVRNSGYRQAYRLTALGAQIPPGAWLETVAPGARGLAVTGRAVNLETVAVAIGHLERTAVGAVALERVTRTPIPGQSAQVQFVVDVADSAP